MMLQAMVMNSECPTEGMEVSHGYLLYLAQALPLTWLEQIDDSNGFFTTDTRRASKIPASLSIYPKSKE